MNGIFVTGTDTGVGKTLVSAALMAAAKSHIRYWKPIQTGPEVDHDTPTVRTLSQKPDASFLPEAYSYPEPASPHHAAMLVGETVELSRVERHFAEAASPQTRWIVEGAGGLMVPLNDHHLMIDLISALNLSTLVVSSTRLGTINHTLLTLRQLAESNIPCCGWVLSGEHDPSALSGIQSHTDAPFLGHIPQLKTLQFERLHTFGEGVLQQASLKSLMELP